MSWLSKGLKKLAKGAKKLVTHPADWAQNVGKEVGKVADVAGDVVGVIPGVGNLAAPILEVGGSVLQGKNLQSHLGAAARGALSSAGGSVLQSVLGGALGRAGAKLPDFSRTADLGFNLGAQLGGLPAASAATAGGGSVLQNILGGIQGGLGGAWDWLRRDGNWQRVLEAGATVIPAVQGLKAANRAEDSLQRLLAEQGALAGEQATASRQLLAGALPLRAQLQAALLARLANPSQLRPTAMRIEDARNPFAARVIAPPGRSASAARPTGGY